VGGEDNAAARMLARQGFVSRFGRTAEQQMPEADIIVLPNGRTVGTPIRHTVAHGFEALAGDGLPVKVHDAKDTAHGICLMARPLREPQSKISTQDRFRLLVMALQRQFKALYKSYF
jgi:hypothetical protein